jgi:transcriptional regulator with XRE-family HTH domain
MEQAKAIAEGRTLGGWTFESLASAAGVSSRTVLRAEQGVRIKKESLKRICEALGIDPGSLDPPAEADGGDDRKVEARDPETDRTADGGLRLEDARRAVLRRLPAAFTVATLTTLAMIAGNALFVLKVTERTPAMHIAAEASAIRAVARYANALAEGATDVKPLRGFSVQNCRSGASMLERIRWTLAPACGTRAIRIESYADAPGIALLTVGPVSRGFANHVVRRLSADPAVGWSVAMSSEPSPRGVAWFDPTRTASAQLPTPPGEIEDSWLFLRLRSASSESIVR